VSSGVEVASATEPPREGRRTWLLIGVAIAVVVVFNLWVLYGGSKRLPTPPAFPEGTVAATLTGGNQMTFAPGKLHRGEVVVCQASGIQVGVEVPRPGRTATTHAMSSDQEHGATIVVRTAPDGRVTARCS
jgi:hypothetical protein